jgi:hypothetical protein
VDDQTVPELTGYQATAAELRRIADAIEYLELNGEVPYVNVSFMPSAYDASPEQRVAEVDAVASAVLGCAGQRHEFHGGAYHLVRATRAGVNITVQEKLYDLDGSEAGR